MVEELVKYIPAKLMGESGKAFHAGRLAFSRERNLYVLGLNPGGAPELHAGQTVADNLDLVLRRAPENWHSYLDETWKPGSRVYPPGKAPQQLEMQGLLGRLGLDTRRVPVSDSVFLRSRQAGHLGNTEELMEACWPFHRAAIEKLGVRVILCLYKSVAEFVRAKTGASPRPVDRVAQQSKSGRTTYWRECFLAPSGLRIVQITRPTRVPWKENAYVLTKRALEATAV